MNIIENKAMVVATNLGETRELQIANDVTHVDPDDWQPKRYELGEDVLLGGNVYRYVANNNAIPRVNRGALDSEFETLRDLAIRIANKNMAVVSSGASQNLFSNNIKKLTLNIAGNPSFDGTLFRSELEQGKGALLSGVIKITDSNPFVWNGRFSGQGHSLTDGMAVLISGEGTAVQEWEITDLFIQNDSGITIEIDAGSFTPFNNVSTFTLGFTGTLSYSQPHASALADLYGYQNPLGTATIPTERGFIGDIDWWVLIRSNARDSFFDMKPAVGIGRRGAVQVAITSPAPFDSVALVNCECLEAEVDYFSGAIATCQVQGADTTPNNSNAFFSLSLTCIGNAPSQGNGQLDGVITLRSDTNFTWNGVASNSFGENPKNLVATRMPNDGANNAPIQRWIVKGAVFDFTKEGGITIINAIGETNFTGSFEGVVSYECNTTITISPDAPHESSDLLFTDLQPIGNPITDSCQLQGVDNLPNNSAVNLSIALTCIGNAPTTGTGRVDGILTLRGNTNFTWDGVARTGFNPNPLVATRMPNDGASNATVQRWVVKDAVYDFTKAGFIFILGFGGGSGFTGSFEGTVSYETGEKEYTATINIKADEMDIPTAEETAEGRPTASIGQIVIGKEIVLGTTDANAISKSLLDFSTIERLPEGDFDVFKRHATYEINVRTQYASKDGQKVQRIIHGLTPAKPAFFYVPDFVSDDESEGEPLGAGMYLYGIIELASFGVDSENEPSADAGELVELKIGGLV